MTAALRQLGFSHAVAERTPGLLIPVWDVHGDVRYHQYRLDRPRVRDGKRVKYETPGRTRLVLDVPRRVLTKLDSPDRLLWVAEGPVKADAAVSAGLCCIATTGVYGWRGTNRRGGKTALPDWEFIALDGRMVYLVPDSDVRTASGCQPMGCPGAAHQHQGPVPSIRRAPALRPTEPCAVCRTA